MAPEVIEADVLLSFTLLLDSGEALDDSGAHSIHLSGFLYENDPNLKFDL